jgi:cyclic pyranopterin phosphate synthase
MNELTHFSDSGRARMVDVSAKSDTQRTAIASGVLRMQMATLELIRSGKVAKGNVLTVADVGAVMAAKRTPDIIPMCHAIQLAGVSVEFSEVLKPDHEGCVGIKVITTVSCIGQTCARLSIAVCASGLCNWKRNAAARAAYGSEGYRNDQRAVLRPGGGTRGQRCSKS